jgi:hypothetical protein
MTCAEPTKGPLLTLDGLARIDTRPLERCRECWGDASVLGAEGRQPCPQAKQWRRANLYNHARLPARYGRMTLDLAAEVTHSSLKGAWEWVRSAPDASSLWVSSQLPRRPSGPVLAALVHTLVMRRGIGAQYATLSGLADRMVAHYRGGVGQNPEQALYARVLALDGLDGVMRERDARALYWLATRRSGPVVFGATRTSSAISEAAGFMLGGDGGAVVRAWMRDAQAMRWT